MSKIWVTAGEGRTTPIDPSIATAPGAQRLFLKPGDKLEVEGTDGRIVRQMRSGDLVQTSAPEPEHTSAELAPGVPSAPMADPTPTIAAGDLSNATIEPTASGKES